MKRGALYCKAVSVRRWAGLCDLFVLATDALDEPSLGIKFAYEVPKDFLNAGPLLLLATLVPTMRDFFDLSVKYQTLHVNAFDYRYIENVAALSSIYRIYDDDDDPHGAANHRRWRI